MGEMCCRRYSTLRLKEIATLSAMRYIHVEKLRLASTRVRPPGLRPDLLCEIALFLDVAAVDAGDLEDDAAMRVEQRLESLLRRANRRVLPIERHR